MMITLRNQLLIFWSFAAPASKSFEFSNQRLQHAVQFYQDGREMAALGKHQDACDSYMTGIFSGRKVVESLLEEEDSESSIALEWLVSSYIACAESRTALKDWNTARSDAWAACMYSQNKNMRALECMLEVCEESGDLFGQLSTLKAMQGLLEGSATRDESAGIANDEFTSAKTFLDISQRLDRIESMMEKKFGRE